MQKPARKPSEHWKTAWIAWDPYDVWHRLLRDNPVCVDDPSSTTGQMSAATARDFWVTVADFPDPLQDALFVIAHAEGFESALSGLDKAIRQHLEAREGGSNLVPISRGVRRNRRDAPTSDGKTGSRVAS